MQNIFTIKSILICFEIANGSKVNFSESILVGFGLDNL